MDNKEYQNILESLFEGAYIVDQNRKILFWNEGAVKITGYSKEEVVNRHCYHNILRHVDDNGVELCMNGCPLHHTISTGEVTENHVYLHHKNGHRVSVNVRTQPIYDDEGNIVSALEVFTDAKYSSTLFTENKRLLELTTKDQLTEVYNRKYIEYQIKSLMNEIELFNQNFGLVFIDIDDFKVVNDTYGHLIGDEVLKLITRTVKHNIRDDDVLGRFGGEEFILLLKLSNINELNMVSEKIRTLVEKSSIYVEDKMLSVTISLGATLHKDGDTKESLIERADKAMYQSKITGKNRVTIV